ncbi:hypothetical protein PTTG_03582, partial [Puccinia triticina 1-1 BBBD Race 1]
MEHMLCRSTASTADDLTIFNRRPITHESRYRSVVIHGLLVQPAPSSSANLISKGDVECGYTKVLCNGPSQRTTTSQCLNTDHLWPSQPPILPPSFRRCLPSFQANHTNMEPATASDPTNHTATHSNTESNPNSRGSTPPPTKQDLIQNVPGHPFAVPSFQEFALQSAPLAPPASLDPREAILQTELQEITAEEFGRSIKEAQRSAQAILALKLPRSCRRKAQDLVSSITQSKRKWKETGIVADDEDIKIAQPSSPSPTTLSCGKPARKWTTRRPRTKASTVKAVDLLSSAPASSTAAPAQGKSASPTNHDRLSATGSPKKPINPWEDGPQESTGENSSGGAASMHIPQTDTTSLTTPLGNTDKTAGLDLPAPGESLTDPTIAPGSTTVKMTKDAELAPTGRDVASNYSPDPAHEKDKVPAEPLTSGEHQTKPQINCDSLPLAQASGAASGPPNPSTLNTDQQHTPTSHASSDTPLSKLTIIKSDSIRMKVIAISQAFAVSKPTWSKYVATWEALAPLLQNCARACLNPPPSPSLLRLQRTSCTYASWIQTINSLANEFLKPSENKQWYFPDVVDLPLLTSFGQKDPSLRPTSFIPKTTKSDHPESAIVRCLYRLHHPPQHITSDWARIVAASVEL